MPLPSQRLNQRRAILLTICLTFSAARFWRLDSEATGVISAQPRRAAVGVPSLNLNFQFQARWEKRFDLKRGETFEISVGLPAPSSLPRRGRVGVRWTLVEEKKESGAATSLPSLSARKPEAFGIYPQPTAHSTKALHPL